MGSGGNYNLGPGGGGGAAGGSGPGRGDGGEGRGRLRRRYNHNPRNPGSGKLRDAPQRCSPGQPANRANRPHASGYGPPRTPKQGQLGVVAARGRAGGALAPSPPPTTRPPQRGNHSIQDSRAFTKSWRAFNFSFEWWPRIAVSFSYSS